MTLQRHKRDPEWVVLIVAYHLPRKLKKNGVRGSRMDGFRHPVAIVFASLPDGRAHDHLLDRILDEEDPVRVKG